MSIFQPKLRFLAFAAACMAGPVAASADASAQGSASPEAVCVPSCRSGFVCVQGACVSACNPPCDANRICAASGECIPTAPPPAPAGYPAFAYPPPTVYRPAPAPQAPPAPPDPGAHKHDGLFLRMQLGFSETRLAPAPGTTLAGVGSATDLAVGFVVKPNLILGGVLTHSAAGVSSVDGTNPPNLSAILLGFGPTAIYYLSGNVFVGAAAGGSVIWLNDLKTPGAEISWRTGLGIFAKAEIGKEWWLSANWALGASFRFHYMRAKESDAGPFPPVWNGGGLSLLFSATYN